MIVDLHCHSAFSDGECSPEQLAEKLACIGVTWAALTDHETTRGLLRFRTALNVYDIKSIPGTEIEVQSLDGVIHLLAYGFDPSDTGFRKYLRTLRHPYWTRAVNWLGKKRPAAGKAGKSASDGQPEAALAISMIHRAGGIAVLAHPLNSIPGMKNLEPALARLVSYGLDGLEVYYKPYEFETQQKLAALAARNQLLKSAGSDYHGELSNAGAPLGVHMPDEEWDELLEAVQVKTGNYH